MNQYQKQRSLNNIVNQQSTFHFRVTFTTFNLF